LKLNLNLDTKPRSRLEPLTLLRIQIHHLNKSYDSLDHHLTWPRLRYASKDLRGCKGANLKLLFSKSKFDLQNALPRLLYVALPN